MRSSSELGRRHASAPRDRTPSAAPGAAISSAIAHAGEHARAVLLGRQVVVQDPRLGVGQRCAQRHAAAARRLHHAGPNAYAVRERRRRAPPRRTATGAKWNWTSGASSPARVRTNAAGLGDVRGQRPAALGLSSATFSGVSAVDQATRSSVSQFISDHRVVLEVLADRAGPRGPRSRTARARRPGRCPRASAAAATGRRRRDRITSRSARISSSCRRASISTPDGAVAVEQDARSPCASVSDVEVRRAPSPGAGRRRRCCSAGRCAG